jgi:polyisoprenoid-binding protein YceI
VRIEGGKRPTMTDRRYAGLVLMLCAVLTTAIAGEADATATRFVIVPDRSRVEYVSGTQLGAFRGGTGSVTGEVLFDPTMPARAEAAVAIEAQGLHSDNAIRDQHLRDKVIEVGRFPAITLRAREFRPADGANGARGEGILAGTLTLHGVERPVSIPLRYQVDKGILRATARFSINLTDFAVVPPRMLGLAVRNEVIVEAQLVAAGALSP